MVETVEIRPKLGEDVGDICRNMYFMVSKEITATAELNGVKVTMEKLGE